MRKINSQPLGVTTLYDSLSVSIAIKHLGNDNGVGLSQMYYATTGKYQPDRTLTPLTLVPVVVAVDPDTRKEVTPTIQNVTWTEISKTGSSRVVGDLADSTVSTTEYTINADGSLVVRKNVPHDSPVSLQCVVRWKDPRTGDNHTDDKTVSLSTSLASKDVYLVTLDRQVARWDPLTDDPSQVTITAKALLGKVDKTAAVKFFWYYVHDGVEVLVDDADDPCLAYVSGQGTATLTVDADYEAENVTYVCRIAEDTTSSSPDQSAMAYSTVSWDVSDVEGMVACNNGDTARASIEAMTFYAKYTRPGHGDLDDSIAASRLAIRWSRKRDNAAAVTNLGWSRTTSAPGRDLMANDMSRALIMAETVVTGPLVAVEYDGKLAEYDGKVAVGRLID